MRAALAWLRLAMTPGVGPVTGRRLAEAAGGAERVWQLSPARLGAIPGVGARLREALQRAPLPAAERVIDQCAAAGIAVLCPDDARYPERLRPLDDAPLVLFCMGDVQALQGTRMLAIVGSRKALRESRLLARRWARQLAQQSVTVVSGMAAGVDWAAHCGALDAGGATVAVLGCGLQGLPDPAQRAMAERIAEHGCVVSEFLPEQPPHPAHFPRRNRIIAGLADGVLVIEADLRSGALITARHAADYGREVMAVPGSAFGQSHQGCHQLIRDGAGLVDAPMQCMDLMGWQGAPTGERKAYMPADEREAAVLRALQQGPVAIDVLAETCGLTIPELSSILLALELQGVIERLPGSRYLLNVELQES